MTSRTPHRVVGLITAIAATVAMFAGSSQPTAVAGGWAIGSLDSMPVATAGRTTEVGFTILQHGTHPADFAAPDLDDVGIAIRQPDGSELFFPAIGDGTPGHYVSTVTFPESSGAYPWNIRMGWFAPHDLGILDVRSTESITTSSRSIQWLALGGSVLLAGFAIADFAVSRRRRGVAFG